MRILHTSPPMGPSYGGPFESVRNLVKAIHHAGHEIEMRMPWSAEAERHLMDWKPVGVNLTGKIDCPPLGWSRRYHRELLSTKADLIHTHGLWLHPSWAALDWKKHHSRPHVVSVRGMLEPWAWRHKSWKKRPVWWMWEKSNLESASLLHATSEKEARSIRERGLKCPIAVIPNGVSLPEADWRMKPISQREVRRALVISRIHPVKGLPMLMDAWAKVRPAGWQLSIVGPDEGGHQAELQRQAENLGIADQVEFEGLLSGVAKEKAYREADLFILPTYSENFGIAVGEAMAHELPVITTQGAPWKVLEDERCGWWTQINTAGIAAALEDAARCTPEKLAAMGARGRRVVEERYSWDRVAREMVGCYAWLTGQGKKPDCALPW